MKVVTWRQFVGREEGKQLSVGVYYMTRWGVRTPEKSGHEAFFVSDRLQQGECDRKNRMQF